MNNFFPAATLVLAGGQQGPDNGGRKEYLQPEIGANMDAASRTNIARQFIEAIPFSGALSMSLDEIGEGRAVISMPYNKALVGDPATGVVHGGAVSALMDTCGGAAVMSHPDAPISTATIDLRIDYMRAATPGQSIRTEATCYHVTRAVAFVRATAWDEDTDRPVASATGAFTFQRAEK